MLLPDEFNRTHSDIEVLFAQKGGSSQAFMEALNVALLGNAPPEVSVVMETHLPMLAAFQNQMVPASMMSLALGGSHQHLGCGRLSCGEQGATSLTPTSRKPHLPVQ